jgi:hypothetical protein
MFNFTIASKSRATSAATRWRALTLSGSTGASARARSARGAGTALLPSRRESHMSPHAHSSGLCPRPVGRGTSARSRQPRTRWIVALAPPSPASRQLLPSQLWTLHFLLLHDFALDHCIPHNDIPRTKSVYQTFLLHLMNKTCEVQSLSRQPQA